MRTCHNTSLLYFFVKRSDIFRQHTRPLNCVMKRCASKLLKPELAFSRVRVTAKHKHIRSTLVNVQAAEEVSSVFCICAFQEWLSTGSSVWCEVICARTLPESGPCDAMFCALACCVILLLD